MGWFFRRFENRFLSTSSLLLSDKCGDWDFSSCVDVFFDRALTIAYRVLVLCKRLLIVG
jgi:hypothetical protein